MTDYQGIWGEADSQWFRIDSHRNDVLTMLTVGSWMGMVLFFVFGTLALITQSDITIIVMLLSLALWIGCGIAAIRIIRGRKKFLRIQPFLEP
jgi:hypothetical protein